jgi:hypothetical protein
MYFVSLVSLSLPDIMGVVQGVGQDALSADADSAGRGPLPSRSGSPFAAPMQQLPHLLSSRKHRGMSSFCFPHPPTHQFHYSCDVRARCGN